MYFKEGANYLLLHNKVSQKLAAQNICYLTVDQECRNSLQVGRLEGYSVSCLGLQPIQWLPSSLTWLFAGLISSLGFAQRPPLFPCHMDLSIESPSEQAVKISARKQEGKEKGTREGHHHLLEPHPRSDTHHFSHILFFRRKSPGPAHSQEQDMTQACDCQDMGSSAVCLRSLPAHPHAAATKGLAC